MNEKPENIVIFIFWMISRICSNEEVRVFFLFIFPDEEDKMSNLILIEE